MTVNQIFDNIQYGEAYMKEKALKEAVNKCYDKELDIFYASKRAKDLSGKVVMTENEESKVNRVISKLLVLEDRIETGKTMSEAYRKMQTAAIMDDCKALIEEATKSRKVDSKKIDVFARIIGATKYFVENSLDDGAALRDSTNPLFNKIMNEEKKLLEETF